MEVYRTRDIGHLVPLERLPRPRPTSMANLSTPRASWQRGIRERTLVLDCFLWAQPPSRLPKCRKVLFVDSSQSEAHRTNSAAFGHSPGPSPSWDNTPQSQQSMQTARIQPHIRPQAGVDMMTPTSAAPTAPCMPQTQSHAIQELIPSTRNPEDIAPLGHPSVNQTVVPVMKSSRKRAVVGSLSPTIHPLAPHDHRSTHPTQGLSQDPLWEARF